MNNLRNEFKNQAIMNRFILCCFITFTTIGNMYAQATPFQMAPLFQDNMVLQQQTRVPVWGKGIPGTSVMIKTSWGKTASAKVLNDSSWSAELSTPKAGGPFEISISHEKALTILKNVLIGEVWLCSGQSNMEMPLAGWPPTDTANGIQHIQNPMIRIFSVQRAIATEPQFACSGSWEESTPATIASFSAAGYFFGQKLFDEMHIPIGLIQSTWGGTPVEAWTSLQFLSQHAGYKNFAETIAQAKIDNDRFKTWLASLKTLDIEEQQKTSDWSSVRLYDSLIAGKNFNDINWPTMNLPALWESTIVGNYDGVIWFRKNIDIPRHWRNKELVIELGPIDDYDVTWVNGTKVGAIDSGLAWQKQRVYTIPAEVVTDSILSLAVRVIDVVGGGGIYGDDAQMNIHPKNSEETISLSGSWKYYPTAELRDSRLYLSDSVSHEMMKRPMFTTEISSQLPTTLYNGMIAPLIPYSIKGAIWYQGESNTSNPAAYRSLFPLMIKNWRADWNNRFSFYFTQIAPFQYGERIRSQELREAQLQSLSVAGTGMAVTLDIGDSIDIHPRDKKNVGERLARWALAKDYKKNIPFSGPQYASFTISKNKIILSFKYAEGLTIKSRNGKTYIHIAGEDSVFRPAAAVVKNNKLIVSSPEVIHPIAVRYAWDNVVEGSLFNKYHLPASSFRTDNWEE